MEAKTQSVKLPQNRSPAKKYSFLDVDILFRDMVKEKK